MHNFPSALQNGTKRHYVSPKFWEKMYALAATLKSLGRRIYLLSFKNVPFIKRRHYMNNIIQSCHENPASQNQNNMKHSLHPKLWRFQMSAWMNSSVFHPNIFLGQLQETWCLNTAVYRSSSEFPCQSPPEGALQYTAVHSCNHEAIDVHLLCLHYGLHLDITSNSCI